MESFSGYSHHEATGGDLPVNHSHFVVRIQRKVYHILSRVADAGKDYSGRTNKIAHHLALTTAETERFPGGPASLFADDAFWVTEWERDPQEFPPDRLPQAALEPSESFDTWEYVFRDKGWAGVPAGIVEGNMKPVSIIVPSPTHNLDLLSEAMLLVPLEHRWEICFATYFLRQAPGTVCHWKFVLERTEEARRMRARSLGGVVDHAKQNAAPPETRFVEAARQCDPESAWDQSAAERQTATEREAPVREFSDSGGRGHQRRSRSRFAQPRHPAARRRPRRGRQIEDDDDFEDEPAVAVPVRDSAGFARKAGVWAVLGLVGVAIAVLAFAGFRQLR